MNLIPRVGIGVIIIKDKHVLLGKRKNCLGEGTWAPPGGHLEFGETFEDCAKREILEEIGIEIKDVIQGPTLNDLFVNEGKHYVTISMFAKIDRGEPKILEPDKCSELKWFNITQLPNNLFLPFDSLLKKGLNWELYL